MKKRIALVLAIIMVITSLSSMAYAETNTYVDENGNRVFYECKNMYNTQEIVELAKAQKGQRKKAYDIESIACFDTEDVRFEEIGTVSQLLKVYQDTEGKILREYKDTIVYSVVENNTANEASARTIADKWDSSVSVGMCIGARVLEADYGRTYGVCGTLTELDTEYFREDTSVSVTRVSLYEKSYGYTYSNNFSIDHGLVSKSNYLGYASNPQEDRRYTNSTVGGTLSGNKVHLTARVPGTGYTGGSAVYTLKRGTNTWSGNIQIKMFLNEDDFIE